MNKLLNIAVASDIELFVQNITTKEIISAEDFVKGTKQNPFVFDAVNKYFCTSADNILYEFCIPPATNAEEFYAYIEKSLRYVNNSLPQGLCTVALPATEVHPKWLQTPQALTFGCEADYNAYTGMSNDRPWAQDPTLRCAGAHLHVSWDEPTNYNEFNYEPDERCELGKAMDLHLGVPAVLMEPKNRRRELYGKAGSFRPKRYGMEYRALSNYFVNDKGKILWLYESTTQAVNWLNNGNTVDEELGLMVQHTINTSNKKQAEQLVSQFNLQIK